MPKVSVYLPDDLYRRVREHGLPLSAITQTAVEQALRTSERLAWVEQMRSRPRRVRNRIDVQSALDAARDEFGS
jgi:post-segregation antitoxin (ccd killing protein)